MEPVFALLAASQSRAVQPFLRAATDLRPDPVRQWPVETETDQLALLKATSTPTSIITARRAQDIVFERWCDGVVGVPMWTEYQRIGARQLFGPAASRRFQWSDRVVQMTRSALLMWAADVRQNWAEPARLHRYRKVERACGHVCLYPSMTSNSEEGEEPWHLCAS